METSTTPRLSHDEPPLDDSFFEADTDVHTLDPSSAWPEDSSKRPTAHAMASEVRDAGEPESERRPEDEPEAGVASILVVDDDPKNLTAMEVALQDLEIEQVQARSGEEALRLLLRKDFALIVLDVQMPGMDGFETARVIRSRKKNQYVPIIFITAFSHDEGNMRRGYELGAVDYLFKPIMPDVLRAKVQALVELRKRTQQVEEQAQKLRALERQQAEQHLIEERRKWEAQALRLQNQQLAETDRKKDEFLAVLAHELRNPLAPLMNVLESMTLLGLPSQELIHAHGVMERQVRHLTRLVDDLLDVSRISRGKLELRPEQLQVGDIVEHALEACRSEVEARQQVLTLWPPSEPLQVFGDRVRLVQSLVNLLTNASRYTKPGGKIDVLWGRAEGDGYASILVRDTGRGLAPEATERIFEMFVQERDGGRGLGLGLTLVRQIVEMHQGTVSARSPGIDQGSEFEVRLPLHPHLPLASAPAHEPPELPVASESKEAEAPAPGAAGTDRHLRIALVEDDEDIRETMVFVLEQWGHTVESAADGPAGVELLKSFRPDVALLDIGLPVLDGLGVARRICAEMGAARPKLVALSGYGQPTDRQRSLEAGFDAHLVKPADPQKLRVLLNELS